MEHPISSIQWIESNLLQANDYNPNVVFNKELQLLELSILRNGWIQPILITQNYEIIDGFHRWSLSKNSQKIADLTNGKVPCCVLELSEPERMLLTIRINRAKGSHIAFKMSDIIKKLINDYNLPIEKVIRDIGATKEEIELLLMDDVFKKLDIQNHKYSKAWYPA
jgi:ParB-like chromosome segregation protein Spo0J